MVGWLCDATVQPSPTPKAVAITTEDIINSRPSDTFKGGSDESRRSFIAENKNISSWFSVGESKAGSPSFPTMKWSIGIGCSIDQNHRKRRLTALSTMGSSSLSVVHTN